MSESPEVPAGLADVDCTGKQALVTGSTSGIGRAAAVALGRLATASAAVRGTSLDLDAVRSVDGHSRTRAYGHSKLATVLFSAELARRLEADGREVTANSVHPGAIPGSGFGRLLPGPLPKLVQLLEAVPGVTSVEDGATELLFAGVSPRTADVSGRYFAGQQLKTPSSAARDPEAARRLWAFSAEMLDVDEPFAEAGRADSP
jgi:NAD(P)-dependent dehydrogenase (short-subunit alcohol dehydrogenase family)